MAFTAWRGLLVASVSLAGVSAVCAKEMKLPADHPEVSFEVPDDWTIETTDGGFKMTSPQKNAIVCAKVIEKAKAAAEAYAKQTTEDLKAFGVTFAADAKVPQKTTGAAAKPASPAKPAATAETPKPAPDPGLSAFQKKPETFTFAGAPSLALPGTATSNDPQQQPANSVEGLTGFGATVTTDQKLPFRAAQYFGTTLNGQPVDVQFVLYGLPDKHYFALMQESGADDGRTVAMAQSVKLAK